MHVYYKQLLLLLLAVGCASFLVLVVVPSFLFPCIAHANYISSCFFISVIMFLLFLLYVLFLVSMVNLY